MASSGKLRTRWAAIGAACAVTLGGGTFGIVQASVSSGDRAVYVPITPVRVLDTRSDVGVATVQDATPALLTVTGSIATTTGQQNVVPVGASSVVINVTAINPTSDGFVSLRPGDATGAPAVSTLNVTVGGTFPNGATITLPTTGGSAGQIQIWYEAYAATGGTTDLLIDVVGYYTNHNHDDRYYTETEVDTALAGKADASELASKANTSDVNTAIAGKANTSDLTSGLASKASVSDLTSGLANKADITSLLSPIVPSLPATIDSTGSVGFYSAITIGIDGNPVISYYDDTNGDLKVAACDNPTCTTSTNSTIDSNSTGFGQFTSIAIGTNGNPIISYADATNGDLKVAACNNPTCTTSTNTIIDSNGDVGYFTSITIGTNGNPIISYLDATNFDLKVAVCDNPICTTSTNTTIDSNSTGFGQFTSIAIGTNGNPIISYYDLTNSDLKVAACNNPTCTDSDNYTLDNAGDVGAYTSITIGTNGNPIISYWDLSHNDLKVAACNNPTCTDSDNYTLDNAGDVGAYTSITIGTNGNPIISYTDATSDDLKVAACNNPTCTTSTNSTIDSNGNVGLYTSMTIGANGHPVISYYDATNQDLKVFSPWWLTGGR
jgi:hypothetical protein